IAAELGVDPGTELQRFHRGLLAADASSASVQPAVAPRLPRQAGRPAPQDAARERDAHGAADASAPSASVAAAPDADADDHAPGAIAIGPFAEATSAAVSQPVDAAMPAPSPTGVRPAQLPADIGDFTGRETHVEHLCALLLAGNAADSPGAVRIAVV